MDDLEDEFNKPMLFVFDNDDLKKQQRHQLHGNMQLIVELFKLDLVQGKIIKTCLDDLFLEMNMYNTEVLCHMLERLSKHVVDRSREARRLETELSKEPQQ